MVRSGWSWAYGTLVWHRTTSGSALPATDAVADASKNPAATSATSVVRLMVFTSSPGIPVARHSLTPRRTKGCVGA